MSFVLVVAVLSLPFSLSAQQTPAQPHAGSEQHKGHMHEGHKHDGQEHGKADKPMMEQCKKMMADHEQMMSRMKEMDIQLQEKVDAMDAAKGEQKVEAMAAVIKEMASQRKEMQERMMNMHNMKMGHMMGHMGKGGMKMSDCPMMDMKHGGMMGGMKHGDMKHGN